jgi:iron complex outermembrane receptor protein
MCIRDSISAEIGIKQGIKFGKFAAFVDVAGFYTQYRDMMEFNPIIISFDPLVVGFQSQNVGNTQIFGVETNLTGEGKLFNKFPTTLLLGYTYIVPKYLNFDPETDGRAGVAEDADGNPYNILKYRFRHTFTAQWDVEMKGFSLGFSGQYYSFMENLDRIFTVFIPGITEFRENRKRDNIDGKKPQRWYKGDFIVDIRAGYTFKTVKNQSIKVSGLVRNLANREYTLRPALVEAPRSYTLRLDFEY